MLNKKVIIDIKNPENYTVEALYNMNHKEGTIVVVKHKEIHRGIYEEKYLVKFDTPAKKLYGNGQPVEAFWFDMSNIKEIRNIP